MAIDFNSLVAPVISAALAAFSTYALLMQRLAILETKMDNLSTLVNKHNNVIERTYIVERDAKTMWNRIDDNKAGIKELQKEIEELKLTIAGIGGTD